MSASAKTVDFSNVKEGGGSFNKHRVPEGDYLATVIKCEDAVAKSDDIFQYLFTVKLNKFGAYAYPYYCKLTENQLWKLRNLAIAAGLNVPKKRVKFDPAKIVGKTIGVTMEDDEYEGKLQSNIAAVFPAAELMDGNQVDDDEDVEDTEEEVDADDIADDIEEEDEEPTADQFATMDRTELKAFLKNLDASFAAKKSQTDDDLRELARAAAGDEDEDEDEDEEPEPPKPAAKKARAAAPKKGKAKAAEVTDEELEELDIDDI